MLLAMLFGVLLLTTAVSSPIWLAILWCKYGTAVILSYAKGCAFYICLLIAFEYARSVIKRIIRKLKRCVDVVAWVFDMVFSWFRKDLDVLGGSWSSGNDPISRLPDELKLCFLHHLEVPDILRVAKVSKRLYSVIRSHERVLANLIIARHRATHEQHLRTLDLEGLDILTSLIAFERHFCIKDIDSRSLETSFWCTATDHFAELYCHCNQGLGWPVTQLHKRFLHFLANDCLSLQTSTRYFGVWFARLEVRLNIWWMRRLPVFMPLGQVKIIFDKVITERPFAQYDPYRLVTARKVTTKTPQLSEQVLTMTRLPLLPEHGLFGYRMLDKRILKKVERGPITPLVEAAVLEQAQLWWKKS